MTAQAMMVMIIGLACGSDIKNTVKTTTPKFKNKETKERTPFLPPITSINMNKIVVSRNKTFMI